MHVAAPPSGRSRHRRLTATPLVRGAGDVHGAVLTLADTPAAAERVDARD